MSNNSSGELYLWREHIPVEGAPPLRKDFIPGLWGTVQGCTPHLRDPHLFNWWGLHAEPEWVKPIPLDTYGRRMYYCETCDTWQRQSAFPLDHNKPRHECKTCYARRQREKYALSTVRAGRDVRSYQHKGRAYINGQRMAYA